MIQPSVYFSQLTSIYCLASEEPRKESSGRTYIINKSMDYEVSVTIHLTDKTFFIFFYRRTKRGETFQFFSLFSYVALRKEIFSIRKFGRLVRLQSANKFPRNILLFKLPWKGFVALFWFCQSFVFVRLKKHRGKI